MAELLNSEQVKQEQKPLNLISECFVKPNHEIEAAKNPCYLTAVEIFSLSIDPIQKGLLYSLQNSPTSNKIELISHLLETLKHSLAIALVHFYPLAGRFTTQKYPEEHASLIFLDCIKGPGARFIHARALEISIFDILSSTGVPTIFFDLGEKSVNYHGHTRALLSVQVTELQDGVFIGFTMNHSVSDGTSFIHFVKMLSEIFRSYELLGDDNSKTDTRSFPEKKPHLNKLCESFFYQSLTKISRVPIFNYCAPCINDVYGNGDIPMVKLPHLEPEKLIQRGYDPGPLRERIFHISAMSLATLKAKANQECGTHNVISSFQALIALVWRSITRVRNISSEQLTSCSMLVNARSRIDPPISDDYFGNLLSRAHGLCKVEELLGHDLGWAAMVLHQAIRAQDAKVIRDFYKELVKRPRMVPRHIVSDLHGTNNVIVGGSSRFDMYGPEFGLGRALAVRTGYANKSDGKLTLASGRDGGGSVDMEICLRPHIMAALEIHLEFTTYVSLG